MLDYTSAPFVRCGKKMKLSSDGGDCGSNKCKRNHDGAYGGVWSQAVGFVLCLW
jgi:hypothetical protein